jgi:hypothetical protein
VVPGVGLGEDWQAVSMSRAVSAKAASHVVSRVSMS